MTAYAVSPGSTVTSRVDLSGSDYLEVYATGKLSVSADPQAIRFLSSANGALITNNGIIEATANSGSPRAIRFDNAVSSPLNVTINNNGTITGIDDAIQIAPGTISSGQFIVTNAGVISSTVGQGLDLSGQGGAVATVTNTGTISSQAQDAIRFAGVGNLTNSGTINGGAAGPYAGSVDGVSYGDNVSGTVTNTGSGSISGDRHGVNAGKLSTVTVTNALGSTISGRNGSGVGSDGAGTVVNYGVITGNFSNSNNSDINGPAGVADGINDGDGDGVDIDGAATVDNYGTIKGTGAGGHGSDMLPNHSEGVAIGGGSITNRAGAIIEGAFIGVTVDNGSQGDAFASVVIDNAAGARITGLGGAAIVVVGPFNNTISNGGQIQSVGGTAIQMGAGNDTLKILNGSSITGVSDLGGGANTLTYASYTTSGVVVNLATGAATATGGVAQVRNVTGTALADTLTGDGLANLLFGAAGVDYLFGGGGGDTLDGGSESDVAAYAGYTRAYTIGRGATDTVTGGPEGGTDVLISIESLRFLDGTLTFDVGSQAAAVFRLYDTVLQRAPESYGLNNFVHALELGTKTLAQVASDFVGSAEFQSHTGGLNTGQFIDYLYLNALHRTADVNGRSYWINQIDSGAQTRAQVVLGFSDSAEHIGYTTAAVNAGLYIYDEQYAEAVYFYDAAFDRPGDSGGLTYWAGQLKGGLSQQGLADAFAASTEFQQDVAGKDHGQLVDYLYHTVLNRDADAGGRAYWTDQLDHGLTNGGILGQFALSTEHVVLMQPSVDHGVIYI